MDRPPRKSRRSSILKVRQTEVVSEKVTVEDDTTKQVMKRRVSFHNVKTVQNFEKDNLNLLDGSPFREKIQETMSSDGILTPGKGHITPTPPPDTSKRLEVSSFDDNTMLCFNESPPKTRHLDFDEVTKYTSVDMSICDTTFRQEIPSPVDMSLCQTSSGEELVPYQPSGSCPNNTQYGCVDMSFSTTVPGSGDDTLAALEGVLKSADRHSRSYGVANTTTDVSKFERTANDTFACLNTQPGQPTTGLRTPLLRQSNSDKSSISTFNDDTALVFATKGPSRNENLKQQPNRESNTSSFMSASADDCITMNVFDCLKPSTGASDSPERQGRPCERKSTTEENVSLNSTDMDVTNSVFPQINEEEKTQITVLGDEISTLEEAVRPKSASVPENPLHKDTTSGNAAQEAEEGGDADMDISSGTVNLVTSEASLCAKDQPRTSQIHRTDSSFTEKSRISSTSLASSFHCPSPPANTTSTSIARSFHCPSPPANTTITLDTETRTTATKDKSGTINLFTTPDKSMDSMRREESVLLKSHLSPINQSKNESRHIRSQSTQDVTEPEGIEIQRRADISSYPVGEHLDSETLLQSKITERSTILRNDVAPDRDEGMDVTYEGEKSSSMPAVSANTVIHEPMEDVQEQNFEVKSMREENAGGNPVLAETMRTLDENVERSMVSMDHTNNRTYSIDGSLNETNITRRDVSIMPIGSRFRTSTSSRDDTVLSLRSLRDETISVSQRMMFDSQSLQVKYLEPADDQPQGNLIREEIASDLQRKLLEVKEKSAAEIKELLPNLQAVFPAKADAVMNMDMRALSLDDGDLLMCSRMRAEIEWAETRTKIAEEARSVVEQLIANDEPDLKRLEEDVQLCRCVDELQREVNALQEELEGVPSIEEVKQIIEEDKRAAREEEELEDQILELEVKQLRLELEAIKLRNKQINETNAELNEWAAVLERNEARVGALSQQIQNHNVGQGDS
nr:LPXTG-motif cell wall anchor domain protein [Haemonchus contortus]